MAEPNLPKWRSHKEVWAVKIGEIRRWADPAAPHGQRVELIPADGKYPLFEVDMDYFFKHEPQPGGYFVQYADGYKSFSPAQAFEEGYTLIEQGR